jgi:pyrimidine deaminase RibD-like protein
MSLEIELAMIAAQAVMEKFGLLPVDAKKPMLRAIELARKCVTEEGKKTPSPKVGAVLVKKGKIIGEAYRGELAPGDHAEYTLLEKKACWRGCDWLNAIYDPGALHNSQRTKKALHRMDY